MDTHLRLLVASTPLPAQRLVDVLLALAGSGVELLLPGTPERLPEGLRGLSHVSTVELPLVRTGPEAQGVGLLRAAADLTRFVSPEVEGGDWPRRRTLRRLLTLADLPNSRALRDAAERRLSADTAARLARALRGVERLLPPPADLERDMASLGVDGILLLSRCSLGGFEPDVIKAARSLGLPSVMLLVSWDNLASKAILNEHPDRLIVWNEIQAREAVELHGVPEERVVALGASNFDRFFEEAKGIEPPVSSEGAPTILYLGSSPKVVPHEPPIFERWLSALRRGDDPALRDARVVVRPHPAAARRWEGWTPPNGVTLVVPGARVEPVALSRQLAEADVVVALNTSAEIEAAITGRPVLTFRAGAKARGQEGSMHFRHLLEASGGFALYAPTLEEHLVQLAAAVRGDHTTAAASRFVESFVRPGGLERPVAPVVAGDIAEFIRGFRPPARECAEPWATAGASAGTRVLAVSPAALLGGFSAVLAELLDAGAELVFSGRKLESLRIPEELLDHPSASKVALPLTHGGDAGAGVAILRTAADLSRFQSPDLAVEGWEARLRIARRLLKLVGADYDRLAAEAAEILLPREAHRRLTAAFRELERLIPPPPGLEDAIAALDVRAVLLVTRCTVGGFEPDVLKATHRLGLPSVMLVASWDNLTTKAILKEHPDRLIVWNDRQVAEAAEHHGIPADRVLALGAPSFDSFFEELEEQAEASPRPGGRSTILYLGSSPDVTPNEPAIFDRWLHAVRSSGDPLLEGAEIAVRPHPGARKWGGWKPADECVHLLVPRGKREPARLAQLLAGADAVVALNTSAELEAAISGTPVLTFRAGREAPGQEGTVHFHYLLREHGGFVVDGATLEEHVERLGRALRGNDEAREAQQRFVERFVRPGGLERPVSPVVASAILQLVAPETASVAPR